MAPNLWKATKFRWTSRDANKNSDVTKNGMYKHDQETDSQQIVDMDSDTHGRGHWGTQFDFILSCIGYAVGLGNLWRFPYLCMRNGGGAFLIPYFTFLFLCGMPLFFMELSLGQFSSASPISVWDICPLFKGLGYGMILVSGIVCVYYNIIITWVLYYLGMSFTTGDLPWSSCGNWWNTDTCIANRNFDATNNTLNSTNVVTYAVNASLYNNTVDVNTTSSNITVKGLTAAEEFWQYNVLDLSDGIHNPGEIRWQLLICLICSWIIVFGCLIKGIKSSGKVVYVTATVPYLFLIILLIRGLLLPGSLDGVKFYITPKFEKLLHFKVWCEACLQIFYSLGPAWGGLITMASYNKFHNNVYRDAIIVPLANCLTSFFGGFVIFSVLGFMAHEAGTTVDKVVTQGPGLAFIAYPEALTKLPISPFWSIMFFLMLLTIGLDSQFGMFETLVSGFCDEFPRIFKGRKMAFTAIMCLIELLIGLPLVTRAGMYVFQILDWYCAAFSVMVISLLECIVVAWIYGGNRLYSDIELMIGYKPMFFWKLCWYFITPAIMVVILVFSMINQEAPKYGNYEYPPWAISIGWAIASCSMIPIPIVMIKQILVTKGTLLQRLKTLLTPSTRWGPVESKFKAQYSQQWSINKGQMNEMQDVNSKDNAH